MTQLDRIEAQGKEIDASLGHIEKMLTTILLIERNLMASEAELDQALTDLAGHVDDLQVAAQSIIDKVANMPDAPDLTDELAAIQGFSTKAETITTAINAAVAPTGPAA